MGQKPSPTLKAVSLLNAAIQRAFTHESEEVLPKLHQFAWWGNIYD